MLFHDVKSKFSAHILADFHGDIMGTLKIIVILRKVVLMMYAFYRQSFANTINMKRVTKYKAANVPS